MSARIGWSLRVFGLSGRYGRSSWAVGAGSRRNCLERALGPAVRSAPQPPAVATGRPRYSLRCLATRHGNRQDRLVGMNVRSYRSVQSLIPSHCCTSRRAHPSTAVRGGLERRWPHRATGEDAHRDQPAISTAIATRTAMRPPPRSPWSHRQLDLRPLATDALTFLAYLRQAVYPPRPGCSLDARWRRSAGAHCDRLVRTSG